MGKGHQSQIYPADAATFEELSSFGALYNAHRRARKGKLSHREVVEFELDLAYNLVKLSDSLRDGSYRPSPFLSFTVLDPKRRLIHAPCYRDRVVQHSLCDNVLAPVMEPRLIYDNAACRVGKGMHFSLARLAEFMRQHYRCYGDQGWFLKCDISRFFDNIRHDVLKDMLRRLPVDEPTRELIHCFIDSYTPFGSVVRGDERGLPLGCQSSQWFALYYLDGLDRMVKEQLRVHGYVRYMDDLVLVHHDREFLRGCLNEMKRYAKERLYLEFNQKTQIIPLSQGVDYLGFHLYLTSDGRVVRRLRQAAKRRMKQKIKGLRDAYGRGAIERDQLSCCMRSYRAHLRHADAYGLGMRLGLEGGEEGKYL